MSQFHENDFRPKGDDALTLAWKMIVSLKLTVALFVASAVLVFFGTLAQKEMGIWNVVHEYFWSWTVWVPNHLISEFLKIFGLGMVGPSTTFPGSFPLIGGKTLGILLFLNLSAGFLKITSRDIKNPEKRWRLPGIALLHLGLLLLMAGEFITREFAVEGQMTIVNGGSSNFVERRDKVELAILRPDDADPMMDRVIVIPGSLLEKALETKAPITDERIPFSIEMVDYYANSVILEKIPADFVNLADTGDGREVGAKKAKEISGADPNQKVDLPSAYIKLTDTQSGKSLGTWLVSTWLSTISDQKTQAVDLGLGDKNPLITLRFVRVYKPYTVTLVKFIHDVYPGTDVAKNFQSDIILDDPAQGVSRPVTIKMNDPMRHAGETFFQSSWLPGDTGTVLQVVENPGWLLPYISCILVSLGMMVHFGVGLIVFIQRMNKRQLTQANAVKRKESKAHLPEWIWPTVIWAAVAMVSTLVVTAALTSPVSKPGGFDLEAFGKLPMLEGGRVKPIDTLARNRLMLFSQRQEVYLNLENKKDGKADKKEVKADDAREPKKIPAVQWLLETMTGKIGKNSKAHELEVFRIDFDQVRMALNLKSRDGLRYSINEMQDGGKFEEFFVEASRAAQVDPAKRDIYQVRVLELANNLRSFIEIESLSVPEMYPPENWDGQSSWIPVGQILMEAGKKMANGEKGGIEPDKLALAEILVSYAQNNPKKFNEMVAVYHKAIESRIPPLAVAREKLEYEFNIAQPFYLAMYFYAATLLFTFLGWIASVISLSSDKPTDGGRLFQHAAWALAVASFVIHSAGLISRMYIMQRPPVTNLHSSAIFIGWGVCFLGLFLEFLFRRGFGNILPGVVGIATLVIAQNLSAGGDTMEVLQAVLDTNFWLATHVTTIVLGYAATYVAGTIGFLYILMRVFMIFQPDIAKTQNATSQVFGNIIYGVVCFATFLSFVGTVLGGIWADQSWGRFWGWDPKENGAVLIVIWNSLILHARWAGLVKTPGMAVLTLMGNMITTWSWFGTNQLGVGLHAYGFNNTLATGCMIFWLSQLLFIMLGGIVCLQDKSEALARKQAA